MMHPVRSFERPEESRPAVLFGDGASADVGEQPCLSRARSVLVLLSGSALRNQSAAPLLRGLADRRLVRVEDTGRHVPGELVDSTAALARREDIDTIVTVGGGSAIGLGKAVSVRLGTETAAVRHIAVPTTYAGSEQTARYGITVNGRKKVYDDPRSRPVLAVYDPRLTYGLPPKVTAESGINALAHCVEILMLDPPDPECRLVAIEGLKRIVGALPSCVERPGDAEARAMMLSGAMLAARTVVMMRTALHHGLCHALGGRTGAPHGALNAVMLPYVVEANAEAAHRPLAEMASVLGADAEDAGGLARFLKTFNAGLSLPGSLRDMGVREDVLPDIAETAFENPHCHRNPNVLRDAGDILAILKRAWSGA